MSMFVEQFGSVVAIGAWEARPNPAVVGVDARIYITDAVGRGYWYSDGTYWRHESPVQLLSNGNPGTTTTSTTETVLATIPVKGLMMANNGKLMVEAVASYSNSANNKTFRLRIGGTGINGTVLWYQDMTATQKFACRIGFQNRNATNSQVQRGIDYNTGGLGSTNTALITSAVDTTVDFNVYFTCQCANGADSATLQAIDAELA